MLQVFNIIAYACICAIASGNVPNEETLAAYFSPHDITFEVHKTQNVTLFFEGAGEEDLVISFNISDVAILNSIENIVIKSGHTHNVTVQLEAKTVGHAVIYADANPSNMTNMSEAYVRVSVSHSHNLDYAVEVVGWVYFVAWSVSFYPQTYMNFKRKSVIGLNFDFLALNLVGFFYYSIFNIGLYWIPLIESQYFTRHQFGVNPVQLNDVTFSIHAFFACTFQVLQCLIYDKGEQKVSSTAFSILSLIAFSTFVMAMLGANAVFQWLDFLYFVSYIKLFITLIKYIPQAYYNYLRKSTSGWSIGNVLLDFTGGSLSILQMFLLAYNYNDWGSIFGDPTKFGLGLFSMLFDIFFIIQHYVLYKSNTTALPLIRTPEHSHNESLLVDSGHSNYGAADDTHYVRHIDPGARTNHSPSYSS